jgi:hypothetical protein
MNMFCVINSMQQMLFVRIFLVGYSITELEVAFPVVALESEFSPTILIEHFLTKKGNLRFSNESTSFWSIACVFVGGSSLKLLLKLPYTFGLSIWDMNPENAKISIKHTVPLQVYIFSNIIDFPIIDIN